MVRAVLRIPFVYHLVALLTARRVAVKGWSMYPTLAPGERVLFDRLAYRAEGPRRGDVVLARHPAQPSTKLVKRVLAVPGDEVTPEARSTGEGRPDPAGALTLGEDEYFLVGDAPDLSTDARHFGPVKRRDILARAWVVYWPLRQRRLLRGTPPS